MQGNSLLESYKGGGLDVTSKKLKTGKDTKKLVVFSRWVSRKLMFRRPFRIW